MRESAPLISMNRIWLYGFLIGLVMIAARCDGVEPDADALLVVEGYLDAGKPLPPITLYQAQPLSQASSDAAQPNVPDADLRVLIGDDTIRYRPSTTLPGKYDPIDAVLSSVPARTPFRVEIDWRGRRAVSEDVVPPPIAIDSVNIFVPDAPVAAILIDTLRLDTPRVGARKGYIYSIDVTVWWTNGFLEAGVDSSYWVETRLRPNLKFSSKVLDVFLLSEQVQIEREMPKDERARRFWTGVYAVPVSDSLAEVPPHAVTVQLLRSSQAYARFTASRNVPERREPLSNIDGAIGILAGISMDTLTLDVEIGTASPRP